MPITLPFKAAPVLAETAFGGVAGAGYQYNKAKDNKQRAAMQGALKGMGIGFGLSVGSRYGTRLMDKGIAAGEDAVRSGASKQYNIFNDAASPSTMAEEQLYERTYDIKNNYRKYNKGELNAYWKSSNPASRAKAKAVFRNRQNKIREEMQYAPGDIQERIATGMANAKKLDSYRKDFIDFDASNSQYLATKDKLFGGARGIAKKTVDAFRLVGQEAKRQAQSTGMLNNYIRSAYAYDNVGRFFTKASPSQQTLRFVSREEVDKLRNTGEFQKRMNDIMRGAVRDARKNTQGRYFQESFGGGQKAAPKTSGKPLTEYFKDLSLNNKNVTTKKEVDKHIKGLWKQNHPDLTQDTSEKARREIKMKTINEAADAIKGSQWYEKLAHLRQYRK